MLPLRTSCRGPAPTINDCEDIIDEALYFFKANVLFRSFEVKGPADRLLVYLTLYITQCLRKLESSTNKADALRSLTTMALEPFAIPGEPQFTAKLGSFFPAPETRQEAGTFPPGAISGATGLRTHGSVRAWTPLLPSLPPKPPIRAF